MQPTQPQISFPQVTDDSVKGFARAWDRNGIKMILDSTSIQFAKDFANTALRSYVIDLVNKAAAQKAKNGTAQKPNEAPAAPIQANPAAPIQANPAPKSSIILTD